MKTGIKVSILLLLLMGLFSQTQVIAQTKQMKAEMNAMITGWQNAYNNGDLGALLKYYSSEVVVTSSDGNVVTGTGGVEEYFQREFEATSDREMTIMIGDILPLPGDYASLTGTYHLKASLKSGDGIDVSGTYSSVCQKEADGWKLVRHLVAQAPDAGR